MKLFTLETISTETNPLLIIVFFLELIFWNITVLGILNVCIDVNLSANMFLSFKPHQQKSILEFTHEKCTAMLLRNIFTVRNIKDLPAFVQSSKYNQATTTLAFHSNKTSKDKLSII